MIHLRKVTSGGLLVLLAGCMPADEPAGTAEFGGSFRMDEAGAADAP